MGRIKINIRQDLRWNIRLLQLEMKTIAQYK